MRSHPSTWSLMKMNRQIGAVCKREYWGGDIPSRRVTNDSIPFIFLVFFHLSCYRQTSYQFLSLLASVVHPLACCVRGRVKRFFTRLKTVKNEKGPWILKRFGLYGKKISNERFRTDWKPIQSTPAYYLVHVCRKIEMRTRWKCTEKISNVAYPTEKRPHMRAH